MDVFTIAPEAGKTYTSKKGYLCVSDRDINSVTPQVSMGNWVEHTHHHSYPLPHLLSPFMLTLSPEVQGIARVCMHDYIHVIFEAHNFRGFVWNREKA